MDASLSAAAASEEPRKLEASKLDDQSLSALICNLAELGDYSGLKSATEAAAIAASTPINSRVDKSGLTPLMRCALAGRRGLSIHAGHAECARHLINVCHCDPDSAVQTSSGIRALHLAAKSGNEPVARQLLAAGAEPNTATEDGWTPLILAAVGNRTSVAQLLLQCRANVDLTDALGCTAEHWAARLGHFELLSVLRRKLCLVCRSEDCSVTFQPCGHCVICPRCAPLVPFCLRCNRPVEVKEGLLTMVAASDLPDHAEAALLTPPEREKQQQQADDRFQCRVCLSASVSMAFGCGHQACEGCSRQLSVCHLCRQPLECRIRLYN